MRIVQKQTDKEIKESWEIQFYKLYIDFSNNNMNLTQMRSSIREAKRNPEVAKRQIDFYEARCSILEELNKTYRSNLCTLETYIANIYGFEERHRIVGMLTMETQYNEIISMLSTSAGIISSLIGVSTNGIKRWFDYTTANPIKQKRVCSLYNLSKIILEEFPELKNNLYHVIVNSRVIIDEDDREDGDTSLNSFVMGDLHSSDKARLKKEIIKSVKDYLVDKS